MKEPAFFELVTNRPQEFKNKCPYCKSTNIRRGGSTTTLVGGGNNHIWTDTRCQDCRKTFTIEEKGNNIWLTDRSGKILRGVPSCFERYIYECAHCGGDVDRTYTELDGITPTNSLSYEYNNEERIKKFRIFFECQDCGKKVESEEEYYYG